MASSDSVETSNDLISNMAELVISKFLKHLPLHIAARTSILSRTWRRNWLSCHYVMFGDVFWKKFDIGIVLGKDYDWRKGSSVINNVLFLNSERMHSFQLELRPCGFTDEKNASVCQWLSLLSRTCPKKITLINWTRKWPDAVNMPSYIFRCTELTKLKLRGFVLYAPPFDFKGFPYLRTLELLQIEFKHGIDMLWSLVGKCTCLVRLRIEECTGMDRLYVDAPMLEQLTVKGEFDSFSLKNCSCLVDVSLWSTKAQLYETETVAATIKSLATSYELQYLTIQGSLCKFLAISGLNKSLPLAFNHLNRLCLTELLLNDRNVFCFTIGMIQSCPYVKELEISVSSNTAVCQNMYKCNNDNYKLTMLEEMKITGITGSIAELKITGITGSIAELKLVEYALAVSAVLKQLIINFGAVVDGSKFNVARELLQFPRVSPKARVICLDK